MCKKLKSFFRKIPDDSPSQNFVMEAETSNRCTRVIIVKKKKVSAPMPKEGIDRFDEYVEKSGLEPKSYQREGVEFCLRRECRRRDDSLVIGGIIADEMGLGKTIMMMGLILANLTVYRRTLIVVPVALIAQWVAQLKRTIIDTGVKSDLTVVVYHGSAGKRRVVLSGDCGDSVWCLRPPKRGVMSDGGGGKAIDIVITTYGCVGMEEPSEKPKTQPASSKPALAASLSLLTFHADRVIFDEAHHLRNKNSRVFKGAMRVVSSMDARMCRRPSVWIVTGTPIQNKISDLKSLCYILGFKVSDLISDEKRRAIRDEYVLRRTKVSVGMVAAAAADAVAADADVVTCAPRLQSLKHFKSNVAWESEHELALSREIHHKARNTNDRAERLKLYTRMRQMCVWPALLMTPPSPAAAAVVGNDANKDELLTHGLTLDDYKIAVSKQSKLDRVVSTIMAEMKTTKIKSIIFCHFRREMTQLRDMLLRGGDGLYGEEDVAIIDGTVGSRQRRRIFDHEPMVLILQIRTCSEGLNLQSYSDVYFISPHWNPCVEDQAIARCYRMGQTSQVRVFRFNMSDFVLDSADQAHAIGDNIQTEEKVEYISTLDHKCEEIQERKRILCNEFLC
jgi:SNF2 family DNA or RNA helicase